MPTVEITIPVPDDVAEQLTTDDARQWAGEQVAQLFRDRQQAADRFRAMMEQVAEKARKAGLTAEMVEEELAAFNASRP
jgi:protein tyrosine phosphatase (PTP) superfamily phosphohydrolase (DUF442 family)